MRRRAWWLVLLPAAVAVVLVAVGLLRRTLDLPVVTVAPERVVYLPPRSTPHQIGYILEREGIVPRAWLFVLGVKALGVDGTLRSGEYAFRGPLSVRRVIEALVGGRTVLHRITIPEGYTLRQIAATVEDLGLGHAGEILEAARSESLIGRLKLPPGVTYLEGFCYPDTYLVPRDWPAERILETMVRRFWEVFDEPLRRQAADRKLSIPETVTLASIIQKEVRVTSEMPLVSAVFHNRLERGIPLMADPVVIYGIERFDGNIRKSDLARPGPYNVYLNRGLPPGPIANPGLPALRAALSPAAVDFLYFVSKNNGTHYFSRSLAEHNQAVNLYQRTAR